MPLFSNRLKELRKSKGATQKQVAEAIGFTDRNYRRLEAGNTPYVETLAKLAEYFNVSTDYLLGLTDCPDRK